MLPPPCDELTTRESALRATRVRPPGTIVTWLFWMGRYMERAEDTARLLDVHFHTLLEQSQQTYLLRWDSIISISGEHDRFFRMLHRRHAALGLRIPRLS